VKGDYLNPGHPKRTRGAGGQIYAASLYERSTIIDPDPECGLAMPKLKDDETPCPGSQ
jgi:hypothetical protein